jgi:hypothetical protein
MDRRHGGAVMAGPPWLDGAARVEASDGGTLVGGPPRWVWHTYEADPARLSAQAGARALRAAGNSVHFVFNPLSGDIAQMLPASQSGRALKNAAGGVETNRMGAVCLQVEVVGFASQPFTALLTQAGRAGLARLVGFARAHGIPDAWPAGPPPAYPGGHSVRSAAIWAGHAGHYGHSQVPENDHGDPGAIDVRVLFATADPVLAEAHIPGGTMYVVSTPVNGRFLVWPDGDHLAYVRVDDALAGRWVASGVTELRLGAADATALMQAQASVQDVLTVPPATVDVAALAAELVPLLPQSGLTAEHLADVLAARLAQ